MCRPLVIAGALFLLVIYAGFFCSAESRIGAHQTALKRVAADHDIFARKRRGLSFVTKDDGLTAEWWKEQIMELCQIRGLVDIAEIGVIDLFGLPMIATSIVIGVPTWGYMFRGQWLPLVRKQIHWFQRQMALYVPKSLQNKTHNAIESVTNKMNKISDKFTAIGDRLASSWEKHVWGTFTKNIIANFLNIVLPALVVRYPSTSEDRAKESTIEISGIRFATNATGYTVLGADWNKNIIWSMMDTPITLSGELKHTTASGQKHFSYRGQLTIIAVCAIRKAEDGQEEVRCDKTMVDVQLLRGGSHQRNNDSIADLLETIYSEKIGSSFDAKFGSSAIRHNNQLIKYWWRLPKTKLTIEANITTEIAHRRDRDAWITSMRAIFKSVWVKRWRNDDLEKEGKKIMLEASREIDDSSFLHPSAARKKLVLGMELAQLAERLNEQKMLEYSGPYNAILNHPDGSIVCGLQLRDKFVDKFGQDFAKHVPFTDASKRRKVDMEMVLVNGSQALKFRVVNQLMRFKGTVVSPKKQDFDVETLGHVTVLCMILDQRYTNVNSGSDTPTIKCDKKLFKLDVDVDENQISSKANDYDSSFYGMLTQRLFGPRIFEFIKTGLEEISVVPKDGDKLLADKYEFMKVMAILEMAFHEPDQKILTMEKREVDADESNSQ